MTANNSPRVFLLFGLMAVFCTALSADIVIDGYDAPLHDRFTNSSSFIMSQFDMSGVAQTQSGRWATALSNNVVASAWHLRPVIGENVYFYANNDPNSIPIVRTVVSEFRMNNGNGTTDIAMGVLNEPLPQNIQFYNIASTFLSGTPSTSTSIILNDAGPYQNENMYIFGRSPFNENASTTDNRFVYNDQAVGRNRITGYAENVLFNGNTDVDALIFLHDATGAANFVEYEARLRGGDSGGPMFFDNNGELVLIGTNAFLLGGDAGSGVNYLGNYASQIQAYILANAVPEPSSVLMLGAFCSVMCCSGRRRPV